MDKQQAIKLEDIKVDNFIQAIKKQRNDDYSIITIENKYKEVIRKSKSLDELTVIKTFQVKRVLCENSAKQVYVDEEYGGYSNDAGYSVKTTIGVVSVNDKENPVRTLTFNGYCAVRAGDLVTALIPLYDKRIIKYYTTDIICRDSFPFPHTDEVYIERSLRRKENAVELMISDKDNKIIRCDRAIEFETYKKRCCSNK